MPISFFDATREFYRAHQDFSTVSQSAAVGLFNLRRDVNAIYEEAGYYTSKTKPEHAALRQRFLEGSNLNKGDFLQLASKDLFPEDLAWLVRMSLMTNISLFEGWQAALAKECGLSRPQSDALEWPSQAVYPRIRSNGTLQGPGCAEMLKDLRVSEPSSLMENVYGSTITGAPYYTVSDLDDLYICFRAWKEARNCITHAGGIANSRFISDANKLGEIAKNGLTSLKWVPKLSIPKEKDVINIPFRDMLAFGELLRRIVCTVDAEIAQTALGEEVFYKRFSADRQMNSSNVPFETRRRHKSIREICARTNFPTPKNIELLDAALTSRMGKFLRSTSNH